MREKLRSGSGSEKRRKVRYQKEKEIKVTRKPDREFNDKCDSNAGEKQEAISAKKNCC